MKLIINIAIFLFVLMIPFALSSQTRKAIPAGRFESLSGIKTSGKNNKENNGTTVNQLSIWQEVQKNLSNDKNDFYYRKNLVQDLNLSTLLPNKNLREVKKTEQGFDLLITDSLLNDKNILKNLKSKGLVVFISSTNIKDVLNNLNGFDILLYENQNNQNYYLLKSK